MLQAAAAAAALLFACSGAAAQTADASRCEETELSLAQDWAALRCTARIPSSLEVQLTCTAGRRYELKVSYPASHPVAVDGAVVSLTGGRPGRRLHNVEKLAFACDAGGRHAARVTLRREGVRSPRYAGPRETPVALRLEPLALSVVPGRDTPVLVVGLAASLLLVHVLLAPMLMRLVDRLRSLEDAGASKAA
eukprot:Rhum_TRINITY_DN14519_c2_g1::Rhum_TRINITY_DN14519_c2_g1_i1::g.95106::m.95106